MSCVPMLRRGRRATGDDVRIASVTDGYLRRLGGIGRHLADLTERQRQSGYDGPTHLRVPLPR